MEDDPSYDITIARVSGHAPVSDAHLIGVVVAALRRQSVPSARVSIALVDDATIAHLNKRHLHHPDPTDVLAFDLRDEVSTIDSPGPNVDGEIVISVDAAAREAKRRCHGVAEEIALYAVHGTLHLLGYDDNSHEDAERMHQVEDEIFISLGVGPVYADEGQ